MGPCRSTVRRVPALGRKLGRVALALVAALLVFRYVRTLGLAQLASAVTTADRRRLLVCVLLNVPLVFCKARRLRRLAGCQTATRRIMGFYFASYAADNLLMGQAGLGVRVALLHREGVPWGRAVSAQAVEKACEAAGLGALALCFLHE